MTREGRWVCNIDSGTAATSWLACSKTLLWKLLQGHVACATVLQVLEQSRGAASMVQQTIDQFAEQPDVYKHATGKRSATQMWNEGTPDLLKPLV